MPWKNGRGTTTEICSDAARPGEPWTWRLSIADVPQRAPFSEFPGVDRHILCLTGNGMRVSVDGAWHDVPRYGGAFTFAGEARVEGEPLGEGVRDVNLMTVRGERTGRLAILRPDETLDLPSEALVILHAGRDYVLVFVGDPTRDAPLGDPFPPFDLGPHESVMFDLRGANVGPMRIAANGGEVVIAVVTPCPADQ